MHFFVKVLKFYGSMQIYIKRNNKWYFKLIYIYIYILIQFHSLKYGTVFVKSTKSLCKLKGYQYATD